jgi:deoxyhypusine synthase
LGEGGVDGVRVAGDPVVSGLTSTVTDVVYCRRVDDIVASGAALAAGWPMVLFRVV